VQRVPGDSLRDEPAFLVHPLGPRVEGVDLETDPVQADLVESVPDDGPGRLGAVPAAELTGERDSQVHRRVVGIKFVEHDLAEVAVVLGADDGPVGAVRLLG